MAHACRAPEEQGRQGAGLVEITATTTEKCWRSSHRCHGAGTGADPAHQEIRLRSADPSRQARKIGERFERFRACVWRKRCSGRQCGLLHSRRRRSG